MHTLTGTCPRPLTHQAAKECLDTAKKVEEIISSVTPGTEDERLVAFGTPKKAPVV